MPKDGGSAVALAEVGYPAGTAIDNRYVYWQDNRESTDASAASSGLFRVPVGGGSPTRLVAGPRVAFVLSAGMLFWLDSTGIWGMHANGGAATLLVPTSEPPGDAAVEGTSPAAIQADAQHLYWGRSWPGATQIFRAPRTGGAIERLLALPVTHGAPIFRLAVDDKLVYYCDDEIGPVFTIPVVGGPPARFGPSSSCQEVVVDGSNVYWLNGESGVRRTPRAGGPVVTIEPSPAPFALDATSIYWGGLHSIMKSPK
jgi:hypothetical protein